MLCFPHWRHLFSSLLFPNCQAKPPNSRLQHSLRLFYSFLLFSYFLCIFHTGCLIIEILLAFKTFYRLCETQRVLFSLSKLLCEVTRWKLNMNCPVFVCGTRKQHLHCLENDAVTANLSEKDKNKGRQLARAQKRRGEGLFQSKERDFLKWGKFSPHSSPPPPPFSRAAVSAKNLCMAKEKEKSPCPPLSSRFFFLFFLLFVVTDFWKCKIIFKRGKKEWSECVSWRGALPCFSMWICLPVLFQLSDKSPS